MWHCLKRRTTETDGTYTSGTSLKNEKYVYKTYSSFFKLFPDVSVVPHLRNILRSLNVFQIVQLLQLFRILNSANALGLHFN